MPRADPADLFYLDAWPDPHHSLRPNFVLRPCRFSKRLQPGRSEQRLKHQAMHKPSGIRAVR